MPRAGGPYAFVERAFGRVPGTVVGWSDWLSNLFAVAFITVAFAEFTQGLGGREERRREQYTGPRGAAALKRIETRSLDFGPWVGIAVQRSFGR